MNSKITERHSRFSEFLLNKWDPDVLQELTLDTARTCEIDQLVPHLLSKRPSQFSFYECQRMIANCDIALRKLHKAGFCKGSFNIFVEDHSRPDVAEAVRISLEDLEILHNHSSSSHIPKGMDKESHRIWHLIKKLQHHYYDNDELYPRAHLKSGKWLSHLNFLCLAFSVGLVSFTKSHVGRFDMDVFAKPISKIRIGQGLRFLPRELSCLGELIKGPVWVLGKDHPSHVQKTGGMKVSMTVYDFVELWEPILMVGGTPEQAPAIRSEGGFIVPSGQDQKRDLDSPKTLRPGEIECHWIKDPLDQRLDPKVLAQSNIQLNKNSRILFGTASSQLCSVCEAQGFDGGLIKDREERHREADEPYLKRMVRAFLGKKQGILRK